MRRVSTRAEMELAIAARGPTIAWCPSRLCRRAVWPHLFAGGANHDPGNLRAPAPSQARGEAEPRPVPGLRLVRAPPTPGPRGTRVVPGSWNLKSACPDHGSHPVLQPPEDIRDPVCAPPEVSRIPAEEVRPPVGEQVRRGRVARA